MADSRKTPEWMLGQAAPCQCLAIGRRRRKSAVERTLMGLSDTLRSSVFSERIAGRPGMLQRSDPRVKTVGIIGLLVVTAIVSQPLILASLYLVTLAGAAASRISLRFFVKRVWLFLPLFTCLVVLPSLFNVFRAGDPVLTLWNFGHEVHLGPWSLGSSLAVTRQGLNGAAILVLRVAVSVSLAVLLTLTTRWSDLLKALRVFRVPRLFVLILSMAYRYIFLLLSLAEDMFTARRSRMVGPSGPREDRHFTAGSMGTLMARSHGLSEEVYAAMVSRGYTGEPVSLSPFRARGYDWLLALAFALVAAAAVGGERLLG